MTQPNIFQEIEADIERQRLENLWRRFGPSVIAAAVIVMLATAAYSAWHSMKAQRHQTATEKFMTLTDKTLAGDASSIDMLTNFGKENDAAIQGAFALFQAAAFAVKDGNKAKALEFYATVSANTKLDTSLRQLADLYAVEIQADDGDAGALLKKLEPLLSLDSAWHYSALEYAAYLRLKLGHKDEAKKDFTALANDKAAPVSISQRADIMLHYIGE